MIAANLSKKGRMMKHSLIKILMIATLGAFLCPQKAFAVTECQVNVRNLFSGDGGSLWIFYTNGGSAIIYKTDPDFELTASFALSALLASRPVVVRYATDGVACAEASRSDLVGFFLL
jgi:hypothetical protein